MAWGRTVLGDAKNGTRCVHYQKLEEDGAWHQYREWFVEPKDAVKRMRQLNRGTDTRFATVKKTGDRKQEQ